MAEHFAQYIFPSVSKTNHKYLNANNDQNTDIGKYLALGAGGNFAGTMLGLGANMMQQENQLANQKELMNMQNQMNLRNAQQAAQIQVHGQQNAGLNPAMAEGGIASAPTVSQGAASMGGMQLANVFDGIANIIAAAKASPEIRQIEATTTKTGAETENIETDTGKKAAETENIKYDYTVLKPEQVKKMELEITKLNEDIQSAKNANEIYQTKSEFIKEHGRNVFSGWRDQLKANGQWSKLPKNTQETIEAWCNGEIDLDVGSLQALNEIIATQTNLSEADKEVMTNLVDTTVALKQLKNSKITDIIAKMPTATFNKLIKEINLIDEKTTNQKIKNWSDIVNDKNFMITKGLYQDLAEVEGLEQAEKTMDDLHYAIRSWTDRLGGGKNKPKSIRTTKNGHDNKRGNYSETTTTDYGL